ncbi:MAG TPA: PTS sugar transporter subunit IIC [Longimicrobiales bacterium]|nr:PTS sugar transporter subunit IIC [Longimicrobiales bacterium]
MTWLALIGLGAIVALDATSFGQLMLSRPFVAAALAGALVGQPLEGALVGALLEAFSLGILPVGASRYPDTGTAAVAAVGTLGLSEVVASAPALLLVVVYGLVWQRISGFSVIGGRYLNERLVLAGHTDTRARMDRLIEHRHLESMLIDMARGIVITTVALLIGTWLLPFALANWGLPHIAATLAVSVAAVAVLAGTAPLFAESPRARVFLLLGLGFGSLLLLAQ